MIVLSLPYIGYFDHFLELAIKTFFYLFPPPGPFLLFVHVASSCSSLVKQPGLMY